MEGKLTKQNVKKGLTIGLNVLFYVVIVLILMFAIANMRVKTTRDIPNLFGTGYFSVQSDSMDGDFEDSFKQGDLIIVKMLNDKQKEDLEFGDIITFYGSFYNEATGRRENIVNTHRIVDIKEIDGEKVFVTQGDKLAKMPGRKYGEGGETDDRNYETVMARDVIGVHKSTWKGAGKTLDFLRTPTGFGLFIVLPAVIILIVEAYFLIRNVLIINKEKMEKEYKERDEELRRKILEELKQEQMGNEETK